VTGCEAWVRLMHHRKEKKKKRKKKKRNYFCNVAVNTKPNSELGYVSKTLLLISCGEVGGQLNPKCPFSALKKKRGCFILPIL
jgi:hypothetical protein